jgi:hypothetical protein
VWETGISESDSQSVVLEGLAVALSNHCELSPPGSARDGTSCQQSRRNRRLRNPDSGAPRQAKPAHFQRKRKVKMPTVRRTTYDALRTTHHEICTTYPIRLVGWGGGGVLGGHAILSTDRCFPIALSLRTGGQSDCAQAFRIVGGGRWASPGVSEQRS